MQVPFTTSGIFFQTALDPNMAACAVADLNAAPSYLNTNSTLSQWTSGWPDGGPQFVAGPNESFPTFRQRIINTLKAAGSGSIVFWYQKSGFFQGYQ